MIIMPMQPNYTMIRRRGLYQNIMNDWRIIQAFIANIRETRDKTSENYMNALFERYIEHCNFLQKYSRVTQRKDIFVVILFNTTMVDSFNHSITEIHDLFQTHNKLDKYMEMVGFLHETNNLCATLYTPEIWNSPPKTIQSIP
jgi:hypothetical protein